MGLASPPNSLSFQQKLESSAAAFQRIEVTGFRLAPE
jgi:hypothetical protein